MSRYQKGKTNLDFTEARDSEWQWHQLGHMQVCISLQTDNHASTPMLSFLQDGCPSCHPTNSVKALKASNVYPKKVKIKKKYKNTNSMSSRAKLQMLFCSKKITTIAIYDLIHSNALKTKIIPSTVIYKN